ncbi:MAG: PqqD family protein [Nocardioides sp.]|uniref:PqqD family protein n=1 Tax=Nocardioides sp. TaxID=35761 RepID=UPI0039E54446
MTQPVTRWRRAEELAAVESPNRFAILDLTHLDRPPVILADTAAAIWRHLVEPVSETDLTKMLAEEYAVTPAEVVPAVADFLARLGELGLVLAE